MRIAVIAPLLLAFVAVPSIGQNSAPLPIQQRVAPSLERSACPLSMHVRQKTGSSMMATDKNVDGAKMFGARLRLVLNPNGASEPLAKARVTVRGLGVNPKLTPLHSGAERRADMVMTLEIPLADAENLDFAGDLVLPGFTAALTVELESVTLENGEVWSFGGETCRVVPDPLMLINR
jgi:hypothetical protein